MRDATNPDRLRGFTLIELLIVIGILSMLLVVLVPQLVEGKQTARIHECGLRIEAAAAAARAYESQRRFGDYPPDDFRDPDGTIKVPRDSVNPGIESFLVFLHRMDSREPGLSDHEDWFGNTDGDRSDTVLGRLDRKEKVELLDPWGNPIAYFHHRNYGEEQTYRMGGGEEGDPEEAEEQVVQAWRTRDGRWFHPRSFQLFSAGPDGVFNTRDDVANFVIQEEDD